MEDISFAVFPPSSSAESSQTVTAIQLSSEGMSCPRPKCKRTILAVTQELFYTYTYHNYEKDMTFLSTSSTDSERSSKADLAAAIGSLQKSNHGEFLLHETNSLA